MSHPDGLDGGVGLAGFPVDPSVRTLVHSDHGGLLVLVLLGEARAVLTGLLAGREPPLARERLAVLANELDGVREALAVDPALDFSGRLGPVNHGSQSTKLTIGAVDLGLELTDALLAHVVSFVFLWLELNPGLDPGV